MSIFSLDWFKSKKKKQLEELQVEEQILKNNLIRKHLEEKTKAYKSVKLVNNILTVVLIDGSVLTKNPATQEDFTNVREASSENEIMEIMFDKHLKEEKIKEQHEIEKVKAVLAGIDVLKTIKHFVVEGNTVYLKGINRSLPDILVQEFSEIVSKYKDQLPVEIERSLEKDEKFQSLKRFFMWCCLNPRAEVANELYRFLKENSFRITKQGFFVALRNVVTVQQNNQLVHFISNAYNKVKAVWKKKPDDYRVVELENGEYKFERVDAPINGKIIGNLTTLYLDLPNMAENRFTDDWTKTFDIRIGKVVNMPMEECNWSTQDCAAAGLHFTADQIHYVGCGDQSVLVLINPMKVVGIGEHKGRCYEYLPIMTVPRQEATQILHDLDFDTLELDEDYAINELEGLTEKVKQGFVEESKKHEFNLPQISTSEINHIVKDLESMKTTISKRVVSMS